MNSFFYLERFFYCWRLKTNQILLTEISRTDIVYNIKYDIMKQQWSRHQIFVSLTNILELCFDPLFLLLEENEKI